MRSFVISLLLPLQVAAVCLVNGTEPADRKNLVNPNGETYPLGMWVNNWGAGWVANYLAGIIIEEMLGIHVSYNGPGPATPEGYYAIAGCSNPANVDDRGCDAEVTYNHVNMELWEGYTQLWNSIQKDYKSKAPKLLSSMGYDGKTSIYLGKDRQNEAAQAEGLPLEYYTSFDADWKQPWKYFDNISVIDKSMLWRCNETNFAIDSHMRGYYTQTGDSGGVVISGDSITGLCPDEYFWLGLKCRSNPLLCIPYFTGGNGWSINDIMQKTAFWNIPLAIAVAKSWGSFSQLPLMVKSTFYWWVPDPTFLDLSPLEMIFPPYDRTARAAGNYRSGDAATTVSKGVSKDLFSLAPRVEKFLDNLQIDLSMMNAMLLDQKQTQDSWENVTCRWLRANEDIWQSWLPDDTTCFAGFGLFDDATNDFATDRTVRENKRCQACPSGTFSSQLVDLAGVTYICVACPPGTSQASGASLMCDPCDKGSYQDETGKQACKRCPVAQYQDEEGGAQCKQCPTGSRTLGLGSSYFTDCGCDEGSIDISTTPGTLICSTCQEGLHCPVMGTLPSFMSGTHPLGAEYQPAVVEGYYVKQEDPLEVYKCGKIFHCPGGLPQTCAGGREGIPCAECPAGRTWTEGSCKMCESWRQVLWGFSVVGIFLFMTVSYYLMTSKVTAKASVLFTTTCAFGMLVSLLQSVGIIGMMTVEWPVDLKGFFSYFQLLLLDLDSFGFACFAGAETSFRYVFSVMFFPTVVFWMFSNYLVSQLIPKRSWDWTKVLSCVGQFLQVTFSTMSTIALAPLMCYTHPNGLQSILKYPNVICGESEHVVMLAGGVTLLVVGVLGFLTLCTYAAVQVPHWSAREQHARVRAFRFLVFRFRLDSWWFGVPLLTRGPLISLPIVLATDYPPIQTIWVTVILASFLAVQTLAWPWKVPLLNALDCWMSYCILILVAGSALYLEPISKGVTSDFTDGFSMVLMVIIFSSIGVMVLMSLAALVHRAAMGGTKEYAVFNLTRSKA
ncbi:unnamed protein product [Durusdinium trenchii]|uniref:Tyrosine-protein kinase ephrin type A/B receptor-like domain-containing protein n=1 Tax=Durusdinium trenchii TaxID=1381693 RepID=A0ABP0IQ65_9DINO